MLYLRELMKDYKNELKGGNQSNRTLYLIIQFTGKYFFFRNPGGRPADGERDRVRRHAHRAPTGVDDETVGGQPVLDLSAEEEACSDASLHISVSREGAVCGVLTGGAGAMEVKNLWSYVVIAKAAAAELFQGRTNYALAF